MPLFLCKWPDGTGTIVNCRNKKELFWELDHEGDPGAAIYKQIKPPLSIQIKIGHIEIDGEKCPKTEFVGYSHEDDFLLDILEEKTGWKRIPRFRTR